jgi:hypothetical protein
MSTRIMQENLDQFLQMAAQDLELQEKLKAASDRDAYISLVVELGKEKGFTSDLVEATLETAEKEAEENDEPVKRLSEQELFAVAGGLSTRNNCVFTARTCQANTYACANNPFCNPDARRRLRSETRQVSNAIQKAQLKAISKYFY